MNLELHDLTAGYALDALDDTERELYERHLPGCDRCQEELASFWEVAGALAVGAGGPPPSLALRERILESARAEQQTVVPFERKRRIAPVYAALTAIAAAVVIGLGLYANSLNGTLDTTRAALSAQERAAAVLTDPDASTVALASGNGHLVVADDGTAVLVLHGLEDAPEGKTYETWVIEGSTPIAAGTFETRNGRAIVPVPRSVRAGAVVAVTVEKDGGSTVPTQAPIIASNPV